MSQGAAASGSADAGQVTLLYLCMEVAGCPTVCRHCWAQGTGYAMMPLADIEWVLEEAHQFCDARGVGFDAYPMHELAAHPDAARLFGLFNSHSGTMKAAGEAGAGTMFEPWPTTGVPLAAREDWRSVLEAAVTAGTLHLWVAFHGIGEVHDRQVNYRGAYAGTCRAVERARAAGLSVGCNVFLTRDSLPFGRPWPVTGPRSRTPRPGNSPWCAGPTSTSTPAWRACTGSGTATCALMVSPPCSAGLLRMAASPMTRFGSDPTRCPPHANWPPAAAMPPGWGSTRDRNRCATCGSTALADVPNKP